MSNEIKYKEVEQPFLFDMPLTEIEKEWQDMPEFNMEDLKPYQQVIISIRNKSDLLKFSELIDQNITNKTKSLWFPKATIDEYINKRYTVEVDNES